MGQPGPLESAAVRVSTCRGVESLQVDLQPGTELRDSDFHDLGPKACASPSGTEITNVDPQSGPRS